VTTATIVCTDVVGSTEIRTRLGEELADRLFERHYLMLRDIAAAHGAVFVKSRGDGVMALFPAATAGLDAIIAIERAVARENQTAAEPITIRAALSAGDVSWGEDDVSGLPPVEAARLVAQAAGGQVLCTDLVRRLSQGRGGRDFHPIGPLPGKGLLEPMQTCELRWRNAAGGGQGAGQGEHLTG
jgi:class 3 adenylate cyclase